jgi:hypothetical protein
VVRHTAAGVLGLALFCGGCLENKETIEVRTDGSVHIRLEAEGNAADLLDGYPLPVGPRWSVVGDGKARALHQAYINRDGVDKHAFQRRAEALGFKEDKTRLAVEADFPRLDAVPESHAPADHPYRGAFSRRSGRVLIEHKAGRTIYIFERTYHGRDNHVDGILERAHKSLPDELQKKLEDDEAELTPEEIDLACRVFHEAFKDAAEHLAREAVLGVFTEGDGNLPVSVVNRAVAGAREAVGRVFSVDALRRVAAALEREARRKKAKEPPGIESDEDDKLFDRLDAESRTALRGALTEVLQTAGLAPGTVNAILYRLEWQFAAMDHTDDLGDEVFKVRLSLPGAIVAGNFHRRDRNDRVGWKFKGDDLKDRDVVLRAVSVVE